MTQDFPAPTLNTRTIENRRVLLRRALQKQPHNVQIQIALQNSLKPPYIRKAAQRGVFICYNNTDALIALELFNDLRQAGIRAWMDEIEVSQLADVDEWGEVVVNALRGCGVLLLLLSPEALNDGEVMGERVYFHNKGKIVLPIMTRDCDISGLDLMLPPISIMRDYQLGLKSIIPLLHNSLDEANI